jgi:hypothetical protein
MAVSGEGWGGRTPEIRARGPGGHHGPTEGARIFLKKAEEKPDAAVSARLKGGPIVGAAGQRMLGQMLHHDNLSVPMCGRGCHTPPDGFQRFRLSACTFSMGIRRIVDAFLATGGMGR